jgi:hypothetical protein
MAQAIYRDPISSIYHFKKNIILTKRFFIKYIITQWVKSSRLNLLPNHFLKYLLIPNLKE